MMLAVTPAPGAGQWISNPNCPICVSGGAPPSGSWMGPDLVDEFPLQAMVSPFWHLRCTFHGRFQVTEVVQTHLILDGRGMYDAEHGIPQAIRRIVEPTSWGQAYRTILGCVENVADVERPSAWDRRSIRIGTFIVFGNTDGQYVGHVRVPLVHLSQSFVRYD